MRRISRPAATAATPKTGSGSSKSSKKKARKSGVRSLNAFAIATAENPDTLKIRPTRLGQREESPNSRKRRRVEHDEEDEGEEEQSEDEDAPRKRLAKEKADNGNGDYSEGSDSEGNHWKMGHVDEDDDSDIDSDEAFDEEDEERFAGWNFGGKRSQNKIGRSRSDKSEVDTGDVNLDEEEPEDSDEESLGEDAVDLAQMLDDYEPSDEEMGSGEDQQGGTSSENEESSPEDEDSFSGFGEDEDDDEDGSKRDKLQELISAIHPASSERAILDSTPYDTTTPTAAGPVSKEKFDISALLNTTTDPNLASLIKKVGNVPRESRKVLKLDPSLPKRQKDRIDRVAASKITKKTLDRWVDSVKLMRRAEHLTFPLQDPDAAPPPGSEHVMPAISSAPQNDLESTILNILQESGLGVNKDKEEGGDFDELPTNDVSVDELLARRAELRRARELMFQEERRAKRIKKIKSKTYRRIHRKEREHRLAAMKALENDGEDSEMDSDEKNAHDRRRAEERMGAKYRDSRWAKQMKKSGRTVWDDDAKSGVVEMARRNEELRKRIAGKDVNDGEVSDFSSSSDDEDGGEQFKLRKLNGALDGLLDQKEEEGLAGLKFMKKAEAARKAENEAVVRRMKRELAGESSSDQESGDENIGRKLFGPSRIVQVEVAPEKRTEFEAADDSDVDQDTQAIVDPSYRPETNAGFDLAKSLHNRSNNQKASKQMLQSKVSLATQTQPKTRASELHPDEKHSAPDGDGWVTVSYNKSEPSPPAEPNDDSDSQVSQSEVLRLAFAGDDFEGQFSKEKAEIASDEDEKTLDNTLEGWGTWVGEGMSKRERKRNAATHARYRARNSIKIEGTRPQDRRDAKLKNVIMSQKRIKGNAGYLATTLPFPFKTRAEYERSIRMPVGGEWNVVKSVQEGTKPRIIVKPGTVVLPMGKPIV